MPGGFVYRLFCGDLSYYGSSRCKNRIAMHKIGFDSYKRNGGKKCSSVLLYQLAEEKKLQVECDILEQFDEITCKDLKQKEDYYICKFDCVNENRAFLSQEEKDVYFVKYMKIYYQENKEKILEREKQYYQENKDKILEREKQYRQKNKDKKLERDKQYRQKNKAEISEKRAERYQRDKDKLAQYYLENKDKIKQKRIESNQITSS
jgi:hypothetical protein